MKENDPKARVPKTENQMKHWYDAIDKLNRIDGRSWEEIRRVIDWCQADEFWKGNILSASTLRKQYPKLRARALTSEGSDWKERSLAD